MVNWVRPSSLKPRRRWLGVAALALGLLLVSLLTAAIFVDDDIKVTRSIAAQRVPLSDLVDQILMHDMQAFVALRDAMMPTERYRASESLVKISLHLADAEQALRAFEAIAVDERAKHLFATAIDRRAHFHSHIAFLAEFVMTREGAQATAPVPANLLEELYVARDDYRKVLDELRGFQARQVVAAVETSVASGMHAKKMLLMSGFAAAVMLIALGAYWRHQVARELALREQEIARLDGHKNALVREVHHRIKNHLQGILGLIEKSRLERPHAAAELATLHGHVLALMAVHGLQAKSVDEDVMLHELVCKQIGLLMASLPGFDVQFEPWNDAFLVPAAQAVPLSLVVSELLVNAWKHGRGPIAVSFASDAQGVAVTIANSVDGPVSLDMQSGGGIGTGLELAQSMLFGIGCLKSKIDGEDFAITVYVPHEEHRHLINEFARAS